MTNCAGLRTWATLLRTDSMRKVLHCADSTTEDKCELQMASAQTFQAKASEPHTKLQLQLHFQHESIKDDHKARFAWPQDHTPSFSFSLNMKPSKMTMCATSVWAMHDCCLYLVVSQVLAPCLSQKSRLRSSAQIQNDLQSHLSCVTEAKQSRQSY